MPMLLVCPSQEHVASYLAALERGYEFDEGLSGGVARLREQIAHDPQAFFQRFHDRNASAGPVQLPDGSFVPRLPGIGRWMWDGEFCGSIGLRWAHGTTELPPTCLGHIGYSVVPWKRKRGYATSALAQMLPEARAIGLPYVDITTDVDNVASQRVILSNGGQLVERFDKLPQNGGGKALKFRITL